MTAVEQKMVMHYYRRVGEQLKELSAFSAAREILHKLLGTEKCYAFDVLHFNQHR